MISRGILDEDSNQVGIVNILDKGSVSIEINGNFSGVYSSFETWNIEHGGFYTIDKRSFTERDSIVDEDGLFDDDYEFCMPYFCTD